MTIAVVWSKETLRHDPVNEVWLGVPIPATEVPDRVTVIKAALEEYGARFVAAREYDDRVLHAVHDADFLDHLRHLAERWESAGHAAPAVPYLFPTPALLAGLPPERAAAVHARAGRYCYDTMTPVGPGTWQAARAAADAAQTAADLVARNGSGGVFRAPVVYALCRPPGHHATPAGYGGSCYLNNAAVAAQRLRDRGFERVAIVDVDAHHGNGTQAIFWERSDVFYGSVHVDPGAGWFPHYTGYADETGHRAGRGATRNVPLPPGTGDAGWLDGVAALCAEAAAFEADALVLSLGVDAAAEDPEGALTVTRDGFHRAGALLAELGLPAVVVQEGGRHLPTLGELVVAALDGLAGGQR